MGTKTEYATAPKRLPLGAFGRVLTFLSRGYDRHLQRLDLSELTDEARRHRPLPPRRNA